MSKGITRAKILKKLPNLKPGNFDLFMARAGLKKTGMNPNKKRPHMAEYTYPCDSVEKLKIIIDKSGGK
jgi:hypothetical protein